MTVMQVFVLGFQLSPQDCLEISGCQNVVSATETTVLNDRFP